jgi:hypothetical protein
LTRRDSGAVRRKTQELPETKTEQFPAGLIYRMFTFSRLLA